MSAALDRLRALRLEQLGGVDREPPSEEEIQASLEEFNLHQGSMRNYLECFDQWLAEPTAHNELRRLIALQLMRQSGKLQRVDESGIQDS